MISLVTCMIYLLWPQLFFSFNFCFCISKVLSNSYRLNPLEFLRAQGALGLQECFPTVSRQTLVHYAPQLRAYWSASVSPTRSPPCQDADSATFILCSDGYRGNGGDSPRAHETSNLIRRRLLSMLNHLLHFIPPPPNHVLSARGRITRLTF